MSNEIDLDKIDWDNLSAGYCAKCREMEINTHSTVLSYELCEKMGLDYIVEHTECCEKAKCTHPYFYPMLKQNSN